MPDLTQEQIQQAAADATKPKDFPGEFTLGDGTVVKATSWEEAFNKVSEMKVNTSAALRDREAQIRTFQEQQQAPPQPEVTSGNGFDTKKYWELMNVDPVAAQNYLDAARFGVDNPDQVPQLFGEMRNVSTQSADQMEIQAFMQRNPDFPGTPEIADKLINTLAQNGEALTARNLEYYYLSGVRDGIYEPLVEEKGGTFIPPSLRGGSTSGSPAVTMDQVNNMSDDQYDDMMRRLGLLKDGGKQTGIRI